MKKFKFFLLSLVLILIFTACTNPNGGYGPSWDITAKIPLIKGTEKNQITIDNLFDGELNIEEGFTMNLVEGDESTFYDLGDIINEVTFPEYTTESISVNIFDNNEFYELKDKIDFGGSNPENKLGEISIADGVARISVKPNTDITDLQIRIFCDSSDYETYIDFGNVNSGITVSKDWVMTGLDFSDNVSIALSGTAEGTGTFDLFIDFPDPEDIVFNVNLGDYYKEDNEFPEITVDTIELSFDEETKEDLRKIQIKPEIHVALHSLEGMEIKLEDFIFTPLDINGKPTEKTPVNLDFREGIEVGTLIADASDLVALILEPDTELLEVSGRYEFSGSDVLVSADSQVGINTIDINIPYEFVLEEDMEYELSYKEMGPVDQDAKKLLQNNVDGVLVFENLYNKSPLTMDLELYVASIPGIHSEEEIGNILYRNENKLKGIFIQQRRKYDNFSVKIEADDLDIFTEKDLYVGTKIIIPANSGDEIYKLNNNDEITFDRIYLGLTGHVNK